MAEFNPSPQILMLPLLDQAVPTAYGKYHFFFSLEHQLPQNNAKFWEPLKQALLWSVRRWPVLTGIVIQPGGRGKLAVLYHDDRAYTMRELEEKIVTTSHEYDIDYGDLARRGMPFNADLANLFTRAPDTPSMHSRALLIHFCMLKGGLVISIYVHANVIDSTALDLFMNHWSHKFQQLAVGIAFNDYPRREVTWDSASTPNPSDILSSTYMPRAYGFKDTPATSSTANQATGRAAVGRIFQFRESYMRKILAELAQHVGRLHLQDLLAALVWMHITNARNRHLPENRTKMILPVDVRGLLWPDEKPPHYMGNGFVWTYAEMSIAKLMTAAKYYTLEHGKNKANLARIVKEIHYAVKEVDREYVLRRLEWLGNGTFNFGRIVPGANYNNGPDLYVVSWRYLFTGIDFGGVIGQPEFVRKAYQPVDGEVIFYPQCVGKDYLEVYVQLNEEDMDMLCDKSEGLAYWCQAVVKELEEPSA